MINKHIKQDLKIAIPKQLRYQVCNYICILYVHAILSIFLEQLIR